MRIIKELKPTLNLLISYYRKLYAIESEDYLPKNFICDAEGNLICTQSTLSRLENNKTQCFDKIYYALLDNLNMSYISEKRISNLIHNVNITILKHAEINDRNKLTKLLSNTIKVLNPYEDYIIYNEQIEVYRILLDYYCDFKFDEELLDKHLELIEIISEELKPIILEIIIVYYTRYKIDRNKLSMVMSKIDSCAISSIIVDYIVLWKYFQEINLSKIKDNSDLLIKACKKIKSTFYLSKTYNLLASLYTVHNPTLSISYLQKAIDAFNLNHDLQTNLDTYRRNLAITACMSGDYELAAINFKILDATATYKLATIFPYYFYSLEKTNAPVDEIITAIYVLEPYSKEITNKGILSILQLYKISYGITELSSLNEIVNTLTKNKNIFTSAPPIFEIVKFELRKICKQHNSYNIYNLFMKTFN